MKIAFYLLFKIWLPYFCSFIYNKKTFQYSCWFMEHNTISSNLQSFLVQSMHQHIQENLIYKESYFALFGPILGYSASFPLKSYHLAFWKFTSLNCENQCLRPFWASVRKSINESFSRTKYLIVVCKSSAIIGNVEANLIVSCSTRIWIVK